MEREDARTVSRTVVEVVKGDSATMRYTDDRGVVVARLSLSRADSRIEQAARRTT
jgi:hypothetical protein